MIAVAVRRPFQIVLLIAALLAFAAAFAFKGTASTKPGLVVNTVCPNPQGIPAGFDYPKSKAVVMGWVAAGDVKRTRQHGWNLWAALNTVGAGKPLWQTWCTETQAFAQTPTPIPTAAVAAKPTNLETLPMRKFKLGNGLATTADPINFPVAPDYAVPPQVSSKYKACMQSNGSLTNGPTLQNNGDVMVAGVIYNQPAYDWIRSQKLYASATLDNLRKAGRKDIDAMPEGSIVLKPMMWPVAAGGFTALPLWDDPRSDAGRYAGFEQQNLWPRAAALTTTPQAQIAPASVTMPLKFVNWARTNADGSVTPYAPVGPLTWQKPRAIGVNQFYNYKPNLAAMAACDRAILDQSAWWAYGREFRQGDYLVLIAMHIMTKEQPAWTFQSTWWSDKPDAGPNAADRPNLSPTQAPGPWRNYLMAVTYGIPASPGGNQWPVAFNPYIELAADHPIQTNCMNCHHRAAWLPSNDEYLAAGGPGALDIYGFDNSIFNGLTRVDSLWSISDRALPRPAAKTPPAIGGKR